MEYMIEKTSSTYTFHGGKFYIHLIIDHKERTYTIDSNKSCSFTFSKQKLGSYTQGVAGLIIEASKFAERILEQEKIEEESRLSHPV
jgi:hypothetical protein